MEGLTHVFGENSEQIKQGLIVLFVMNFPGKSKKEMKLILDEYFEKIYKVYPEFEQNNNVVGLKEYIQKSPKSKVAKTDDTAELKSAKV